MYRDTLLALSKDPRFRAAEPLPQPLSERRNPACGDEIALHCDLQDDQVTDLRFYAQGCAVCVASAAALCLELDGIPVPEARERVEQALHFFDSDAAWTQAWGEESIPALGAVRERPMRMACVRLAWQAMQDALK
jgi:nitrogen fixation NifU-like protein